MLKGIDPILSPGLLQILASMGHGDELLIADANFPAAALAKRLCRLDGVDTTRALRAVLSLFPLDQYVEAPAGVMAVVGDPDAVPETEKEFRRVLDEVEGRSIQVNRLERFAFYERAKTVFAVLVTSERRLYGNIILAKGVIRPDE